MNERRGIKLTALLLSGLVFLTACSNGKTNQTETSKETVVEQNTETQKETKVEETKVEETKDTETTNNQATSKVDINRAVEIFHDTFSDKSINITQIEYDRDNGRYTYEIEGWKDNQEFKLEIDAETEEILKQKSEIDDVDKDDIVIDLDKIVSPEKAVEEALKQANATKIEGWELDTENGVLVYEIDVEDGKDVVISATDGSFIEFD